MLAMEKASTGLQLLNNLVVRVGKNFGSNSLQFVSILHKSLQKSPQISKPLRGIGCDCHLLLLCAPASTVCHLVAIATLSDYARLPTTLWLREPQRARAQLACLELLASCCWQRVFDVCWCDADRILISILVSVW
jgi:hypothetical protein